MQSSQRKGMIEKKTKKNRGFNQEKLVIKF